jgi:uncharacterized membrane protein YphA (DoxX/SURF4 family)
MLQINIIIMNPGWKKILLWILRIVPALILLQTLYFKFTAHPQSVKLFTALGMEPWGRIGTGITELIAAVLLIIPRFSALGALLAMGLMAGAIYFHLTVLGIEFDGDYGLFSLALVTLVSVVLLLLLLKGEWWKRQVSQKQAR